MNEAEQSSETSLKRSSWFRRALFIGVRILVVLLIIVAGYYGWVVWAAREHTISTVLPMARAATFPLATSDLSARQLDILLRVEDPQFFQHSGVDFSTPGAGITTITQGLVKQLYFEKFEPGIAKLKQTLIARYALDPLMPKQEQLRLFINTVYLGKGARGFAEGARACFNKPFQQLTEDEYIALVAAIIAPGVFDVRKFPDRNAERVARIKKLVNGDYKPRGLFDMYYGKIDAEGQKDLPAFSYFESYYKE